MTNAKIVHWWAYAIWGIVLFGFLAPAMISVSDTIIVLAGVVFMVLYALWSYALWVKPLIILIKEDHRER